MAFCTQCGSPLADRTHAFCGVCGARTQAPGAGDNRVAKNAAPDGQVDGSESKKARARKWVNGYALTGSGVAAAAIIPGATTAALFTLETTMVLHIGRIYRGQHFSKEDAVAVAGAAGFMGTVGLGAKVAMEGLTFFPVVGWAIKGGIAGTVIKTLGELIIKYFESIEQSELEAGNKRSKDSSAGS